mmetsp:Transcript_36943/g.83185  ORF Transcript_36943/g.83185 Transcript_36943/m.83185 type:complete len:95 (+) Transcript_36943:132-416(+)
MEKLTTRREPQASSSDDDVGWERSLYGRRRPLLPPRVCTPRDDTPHRRHTTQESKIASTSSIDVSHIDDRRRDDDASTRRASMPRRNPIRFETE